MEEGSVYNERELLLQVAEGREDAFNRLFHRYRGKLYHYVLTFTESRETAEDIVHDVFLKLWNNREKLPAIDNLNSYIYKMCRNQFINGIRQSARETLVLAELRKETIAPVATIDISSQKEIRTFILQAIEKLSPQQRKVFILSRQDGLRHKQIAESLGISVNTVRTHLADALRILREEIGRSYGSSAIAIWVIYQLT